MAEFGFTPADIWNDFKKTSRTERGTLDDNANEVILGPRLNAAIHDWANGYLKTLKLDPNENKAMDERAKLLDLHWGRVEHDGALLQGLGAAMTNFAEVLGANVGKLAERWKGDSYDAFKAAIDQVQRTIAEYGAAATTTGDGVVEAMARTRELYQTFAEDSVRSHLHFEVSPPKEWHRVPSDGYTVTDLVNACPTLHSSNYMCLKGHAEQETHLNGQWVTESRWEICRNDPCETNAGRVVIMYDELVDECKKAIGHIRGKLDHFYGAVKTVVDGVTSLYDVALTNVHDLAHEEVFSSLRVIATGSPTGGDPVPTGGGDPVPTAGEVAPADGDPGPAVAVEPPQPSPTETPPADAAAQADESVKIQDGDRTIGVTSPDGEGHVRVTVQDAAGQTKAYDLDFGTASGLASPEPTPNPDGAEQVPARTDGKCVIQDGPLTITAERPLFSPDSIKLVVDDGSGKPSTYTLDFDDQNASDQHPGTAGPGPTGPDPTRVDSPGPAPATSARTGPAIGPAGASPAGPNGAPASTGLAVDPAEASPAGANGTPVAAGPAADQAAISPGGIPAPTGETADSAGASGAPAGPAVDQAAGTSGPAPAASDVTTPQADWHGDQAGSVSGELIVPELSGEAGLAAAPDDPEPQVGGMVGSGLPVAGGSSGGGQEGGRVGSGWSVHGDLFDNAEPVYSMHGILGDDDRVGD